jgi:hypothetical protein
MFNFMLNTSMINGCTMILKKEKEFGICGKSKN